MDIGKEMRIIEVEPEPIEFRPEEEETAVPVEKPAGEANARTS